MPKSYSLLLAKVTCNFAKSYALLLMKVTCNFEQKLRVTLAKKLRSTFAKGLVGTVGISYMLSCQKLHVTFAESYM